MSVVAFVRSPAVTAAAEAEVRAAELTARRARRAPAPGPCTLACAPTVVCHADVRVFVDERPTSSTSAAATTAAALEYAGRRVHVCVAALCGARDDPRAHTHERTRELRAAHWPLLLPRTASGGCYFCPTHLRAHVCVGTRCAYTAPSTHGFAVCVLSGRTVSATFEVEYGTGTTCVSEALEHILDGAERTRRDALASNRSAASSAVSALLDAGNADARTTYALGAPKTEPELAAAPTGAVYIDVDVPASDVFPNDARDNTFGDNMAGQLARDYSQAYATVHLLLFSEARARIEATKCARLVARARARIDAYIVETRKRREPVFAHVCAQLEAQTFASRRLFPTLVLPHHGRARLTAYFAVVCVEAYLQLLDVVSALESGETVPATAAAAAATTEKPTKRRRRLPVDVRNACARFKATPIARVVPNVLVLLRDGLASESRVLARHEPLLAHLPEAPVIEALGVAQRACTENKKDMRKLLHAAGPAAPALTQLETRTVLFERETSVISLFLDARRARLHRH